MLWPYELKDFAEKLNELKVDYYRITPMDNFAVITTYITLKITAHGAVQFMSEMKDCKETYMEYPGGNPVYFQGYVFFAHHFM